MEEQNHLIKERIRKLEEMKEKGVDAFPYSYDQKQHSDELQEKYKKLKKEEKTSDKAKVAGRIIIMRKMGKAMFVKLQDAKGTIQLFATKDTTKEYDILKKLDNGDWIGAEGTLFKTKTGELTIDVKKFTFLSKALRPLPEKFHGLKDPELRYRQRYVDLIMNRDVQEVFMMRSKIINAVREFLAEKGFTEVEVPALQTIYGGANAKPFKTHINAWNMDLYLSISPELYLKRAIVGGMEKVYTICKNFRNEGVDKTHNPEFTMMECYLAYVDYDTMMELTEELYVYVAKKVIGKTKIMYQGTEIELKKPWPRMTMKEAIKKHVNVDVDNISDDEMKDLLRGHNIEYEGDYSKGLATELLFEELVEDKMIQPVFIIDHPKESTPLCKAKRGDDSLIERFEPYINGWEIGNAYSELNDAQLQKQLLEEQEEKGRGGDEEHHPMDEDFIQALEYGMPPTGGLGLGIDRMVMLLTDQPTIRDVIMFPTMKPEK